MAALINRNKETVQKICKRLQSGLVAVVKASTGYKFTVLKLYVFFISLVNISFRMN